MKLRMLVHCFAILFLVQAGDVFGQEPAEPLSRWQWYQEIALPKDKAAAKYVSLLIPATVFDASQTELHDLRLADGKGRPIPYALFVRNPTDTQAPVEHKKFAEGSSNGATAVRLELKADGKLEHNAVKIITPGSNFRRRVEIEGKTKENDKWSAITLAKDKAHVVDYQVNGKEIKIDTVRYAESRLPLLRVRVFADPSEEKKEPPEITDTTVLRQTRLPGKQVSYEVSLGAREPVRDGITPASAWMIDLGAHVPCAELLLTITESGFSRPYRLESIERQGVHSVLVRGELQRRAGEEAKPLKIEFAEVVVKKLRLVIADAANPPLTLTAAQPRAAARELIFEYPKDAELPLRLYYGNPDALAPRYDFAADLPPSPKPEPQRADLGPPAKNPVYEPPALDWSERFAWLIYVVLAISSLGLLTVLGVLARESLRRQEVAR